MKKIIKKSLLPSLIGSILLFTTSYLFSAPILFNFTQSGFGEGAVVTGMFIGNDLDGNGQLSSRNNEVSDFTMQFSGNSHISPFVLQSVGSNSFGLVYDLNDGALGDGISLDIEGIGIISDFYTYYTGVGPGGGECGIGIACGFVSDLVNGPISGSSQLVLVSTVPIPTALLLFSSGLIGLIGIGRNKSGGGSNL